MALLRAAELHVELFEARFGGTPALVQLFDLRADLAQLFVELPRARAGSLGLLRQPHQLDLHFVRTLARRGRVALHGRKALRCVAVRCFGAHRASLRLFGQQGLRTHLSVEVLDFLRARQHAGLLAVGRVEGDRMLRHRVALARHDHFAVRELVPAAQCRIERIGGVHAFEPVVQQRLQPGIAELQQRGQARQRMRCACRRQQRRWRTSCSGRQRSLGGIERQARRRRVGREGAHGVDAADFEGVDALAQYRFERGFPSGLDVHSGPQPLQAFETVALEPGLDAAFGLHAALQRAQRVEPRRQFGQARGFALRVSGLGATRFIQRGHRLHQLGQARVDAGLRLGRGRVLLGQLGDAGSVGSAEALTFGG